MNPFDMYFTSDRSRYPPVLRDPGSKGPPFINNHAAHKALPNLAYEEIRNGSLANKVYKNRKLCNLIFSYDYIIRAFPVA